MTESMSITVCVVLPWLPYGVVLCVCIVVVVVMVTVDDVTVGGEGYNK